MIESFNATLLVSFQMSIYSKRRVGLESIKKIENELLKLRLEITEKEQEREREKMLCPCHIRSINLHTKHRLVT